MNPLFPVLQRFGPRFPSIEACDRASGGFSGAEVWRVVSQNVPYALRRWPEGTSPSRLDSLHRLLRHLGKRAVPIAVPVADDQGRTLQHHAGRWWQLEPWLPGQADFLANPTDARLASAMQTLAGFHIDAATFAPSEADSERFGGPAFGPAPSIADRETLLRYRILGEECVQLKAAIRHAEEDEFACLARRAIEVFSRCGEKVYRELRDSRTVPVPLIPCLRDVCAHVLFTGDKVTGLIDPAACRRDTIATDLSRLLGSLIGDDRPRWNTAIDEYTQHRSLSNNEIALIPVLDHSGLLLSAATWLRRRDPFDQPCDTPAVIARLRETVTRLEQI